MHSCDAWFNVKSMLQVMQAKIIEVISDIHRLGHFSCLGRAFTEAWFSVLPVLQIRQKQKYEPHMQRTLWISWMMKLWCPNLEFFITLPWTARKKGQMKVTKAFWAVMSFTLLFILSNPYFTPLCQKCIRYWTHMSKTSMVIFEHGCFHSINTT